MLLALASCAHNDGAPVPPAVSAPAGPSGATGNAASTGPELTDSFRASIVANLPRVQPELGELVVTRSDPRTGGDSSWTAPGLVTLVDAPGSRTIVGHLAKGTTAMADAAEMHVTPNPVRVVREHVLKDGRVVKPGDVVWQLDTPNGRESNIWWNGAITTDLIFPAWDTRSTRDRFFWAAAGEPVRTRFWTHLTTSAGPSGWLDTTNDSFWPIHGEPDDPPGVAPRSNALPPKRPARLASVYIDRDACPFECCHFGQVSARVAVALVAAPRSTRIVADVWPDEIVTADGDEVHVVPRPVRVRVSTVFDEDDGIGVTAGEIVWLLEEVGEGYVRIWRDGKVFDAPDPEDWPDPASDRVHEDSHWWVRVRTKSGVVGWIDNSNSLFDGFDGCA